MALKKDITQDDGVVTSYHRIAFVQITTNRQNSITVFSYVNDDVREREKEEVMSQPYCKSVTYETDYDAGMTVEAAYEYLKSLPEFKEAKNV